MPAPMQAVQMVRGKTARRSMPPCAEPKFLAAFDAIFTSIGIRIITTPVRAPKANAIA
jgi:hypothetical protein